MNKPFNVLPHDLEKAVTHYSCSYSCITRAENALVEGDYDLVIKRAEDLIRSAKQLKNMQHKKYLIDEVIGEIKGPTLFVINIEGR
ncbi:hypothetical protein [Mesobacillus stamsii]|uniref:Uncharacterized protein n=1 Tax=Mesobacillus stamsii TaxID=225347 RepID=A0ABU0FXB6_9BACI|nr:hypothetical protein [Mesobacillus stamsii]MDQ0414191.1 hypothetical protein [Mesobacillus stamsii]